MEIKAAQAAADVKPSVTQEQLARDSVRDALRIQTLADARARFEQMTTACETALRYVEEAWTELGEDELDDFETAKAKADKIYLMERQHDRCLAAWEVALRRMNWARQQVHEIL